MRCVRPRGNRCVGEGTESKRPEPEIGWQMCGRESRHSRAARFCRARAEEGKTIRLECWHPSRLSHRSLPPYRAGAVSHHSQQAFRAKNLSDCFLLNLSPTASRVALKSVQALPASVRISPPRSITRHLGPARTPQAPRAHEPRPRDRSEALVLVTGGNKHMETKARSMR